MSTSRTRAFDILQMSKFMCIRAELFGWVEVTENDDADALIHVPFIDFIQIFHVFKDSLSKDIDCKWHRFSAENRQRRHSYLYSTVV